MNAMDGATCANCDALEAERDAIQAAWNRDRSLLDVAIDHHMSRWRQAEAERDDALARLAAAEAALAEIRQTAEYADHWPANACRQILEVVDEFRAALAGSRERAQGEGA